MAKRGRKPKERKGYFYEQEEQAIVDYIKTTNPEEKNRIFNTILLPALTKMIESIIRRYKLFVPDEEFPQTFNDTISYLLTKINNFKPEMWVYEEVTDLIPEHPVDITETGFKELKKTLNENSPRYVRVFHDGLDSWGYKTHEPYYKIYQLVLKRYKAYSYCGTVCKNYLIYKNIQYTKNRQRNLPYDEMIEDFSKDPNFMVREDETTHYTLVEKLIKEMSKEIKDMMKDQEKNALTADEIKVGTALAELLDNWEEVLNVDGSNKLQKSSVLYFLREETMMSTKQVRDNMKKFRVAYFLLKRGLINE